MMKFFVIALGWAYMILAVWWFFRPARIRKKFERSYRKKLRWLFVVLAFAIGGVIYSAGKQVGGWIGTALIVIGIIAMLKGLFFLSGKATDKVLDWWLAQPDSVYRMAAVLMFVCGLLAQWLFRV